jgi:hypothetical protein
LNMGGSISNRGRCTAGGSDQALPSNDYEVEAKSVAGSTTNRNSGSRLPVKTPLGDQGTGVTGGVQK